MLRATLIVGILLVSSNLLGQEGLSAYNDPFGPNKPVTNKNVGDENNSFFPKIPTLKMPKIPNLNPFAKKVNGPLMNNRRPNVLKQIGTGTKNFFTKTGQTLMPWTKPKMDGTQNQIVPAYLQNASKPKKQGTGIKLMSFFQPEPKVEKPRTANEFFSRPRPGIDK